MENDQNDTPLHLACMQRDGLSMVNLFLERGASVNATNAIGWTPLMYAVENKSLDIMTVLLQQYNKLRSYLPEVAFYYAIKAFPHPEVLRLLAKAGCHFCSLCTNNPGT